MKDRHLYPDALERLASLFGTPEPGGSLRGRPNARPSDGASADQSETARTLKRAFCLSFQNLEHAWAVLEKIEGAALAEVSFSKNASHSTQRYRCHLYVAEGDIEGMSAIIGRSGETIISRARPLGLPIREIAVHRSPETLSGPQGLSALRPPRSPQRPRLARAPLRIGPHRRRGAAARCGTVDRRAEPGRNRSRARRPEWRRDIAQAAKVAERDPGPGSKPGAEPGPKPEPEPQSAPPTHRAGFRRENGHQTEFWHGSTPSGAHPKLATWPFAESGFRGGSRTPPFRARTRFRGHFSAPTAHACAGAPDACASFGSLDQLTSPGPLDQPASPSPLPKRAHPKASRRSCTHPPADRPPAPHPPGCAGCAPRVS